jgi:hypothetical protein
VDEHVLQLVLDDPLQLKHEAWQDKHSPAPLLKKLELQVETQEVISNNCPLGQVKHFVASAPVQVSQVEWQD